MFVAGAAKTSKASVLPGGSLRRRVAAHGTELVGRQTHPSDTGQRVGARDRLIVLWERRTRNAIAHAPHPSFTSLAGAAKSAARRVRPAPRDVQHETVRRLNAHAVGSGSRAPVKVNASLTMREGGSETDGATSTSTSASFATFGGRHRQEGMFHERRPGRSNDRANARANGRSPLRSPDPPRHRAGGSFSRHACNPTGSTTR